MDSHKNVDDKIAAERHKALSYSSYTDGSVPSQATKSSSGGPFIRFSYLPKKSILLAAAAGLVLIVGGASALVQLNSGDDGLNEPNSSETATEDGTYVGYGGEEASEDNSADTTGKDDSKKPSIISSALETLGLIKKTNPSSKPNSSNSGGSSGGNSSGGSSSGSNSQNYRTATKLLVFVVENHSYSAMQTSMPYLNGLAKKYGYATNYYATSRPSLPNYLAIVTGSSRGVTDNKAPSVNEFQGSSIFAQAIRNGKSGALYSESMTTNCKLTDSANGDYAVKHNAWAYVKNERGLCQTYNANMDKFSAAVTNGKLPTIGMVVPNMCNSGHDCSLATTDAWLKQRIDKVFANSDWKSGHLAVAVLSEEAAKSDSSNRVFFVLMHESQKSRVASCTLNHYSLSRLYSNISRSAPILNAKNAASLSSCFKLPI